MDPFHGSNPLNNFHRTFVYIYPDYFVVFDRISTKKDYYTPAWTRHLGADPVISTDTVTATVGDSNVFCKVLLPENFVIDRITESNTTYGRIEVKPTQPAVDDLFLHVLHITDTSNPPMPSTYRIDGTTIVGVQSSKQPI